MTATETVTVPLFQRYRQAPRVPLPEPGALPPIPFAEVLTGRRTVRDFAETAVDVQRLSQLLYHTHYPHHLVNGVYGWLPRRAWANGGARGELELYVLARRVDGLDRGLYHYQADGHQLELIGQDPGDAIVRELACGQEMCVSAPVTVLVTAVPGRCAVKYRTARALRVVYMDSGCLTQAFCMVATALGLGPYVTAALADADAERVLGIDGVRDTLLLLLVPVCRPGSGGTRRSCAALRASHCRLNSSRTSDPRAGPARRFTRVWVDRPAVRRGGPPPPEPGSARRAP